jgi:hypothetical protein
LLNDSPSILINFDCSPGGIPEVNVDAHIVFSDADVDDVSLTFKERSTFNRPEHNLHALRRRRVPILQVVVVCKPKSEAASANGVSLAMPAFWYRRVGNHASRVEEVDLLRKFHKLLYVVVFITIGGRWTRRRIRLATFGAVSAVSAVSIDSGTWLVGVPRYWLLL